MFPVFIKICFTVSSVLVRLQVKEELKSRNVCIKTFSLMSSCLNKHRFSVALTVRQPCRSNLNLQFLLRMNYTQTHILCHAIKSMSLFSVLHAKS